jgi:hypothetical protein
MEHSDLKDTARILMRQWGLPDTPGNSWEQLRQALKARLRELLDDDFSALVNAMYRLDVAENRFKAALEAGNSDLVAENLAEIVLQRELQRLETRRKYSSGTDQQTSD